MKHKALLLALLAVFILIAPSLRGQTIEYSFSATAGTFEPISGGLLLGTETSDDQRFLDPAVPAGATTTTGPGLDIGFNFTFNGAVFDRLAINNNGWISLGQSSLTPSVNNSSTSGYTPISSAVVITPDVLYNRIAAMARDLQAQAGASLRLETIGTAPNRVCVVQWLGYKKYGTSGTGDNLNFQIRLYETTNNIKIVYGAITANATAGNMQVGLRGPLATDFHSRTGSTGWNNTTASALNTEYVVLTDVYFPANGLTFNFDFPVANQPPNAANLVYPGNNATLISPSASLNWTSGGGLPTGYRLSLGTDNPPTNLVNNQDLGAVNGYQPTTPLSISTTYYWKIVPYNAFGDAANCPVWSFTTHGDPTISTLPYTQHWDAITPPALPFDWTALVQSPVTTAYAKTVTTSPHSSPNCAALYNGADMTGSVMLVGPELVGTLNPSSLRVKFWGKGGTTYRVHVGVMSNPTDPTTFVMLHDLNVVSNWNLYTVDLTAYTGTGRFIALKHGMQANSQTVYIDEVTFEQIHDNDLACTSLTGEAAPSAGTANTYTANILNAGLLTQANYMVKLYNAENTEIASAPGTSVAAGTSVQIPLIWTPSTAGNTQIYAKVILAGDQYAGNDQSPNLPVAVQAAGTVAVTIGDGSAAEGMPVDFYYKNSLYQTLYFEPEINTYGAITAMIFYNNFVTNISDKPVKFWLGTTTQADLSAGWILDGLTLVFDGTLSFPSGENNIVVPLNTPYPYTGGTLLLYANRPMDTVYFNNNDNFKTQIVGNNRARKLTSDSTTYDPMAPSAAGTLSGNFPKTTFLIVTEGMASLGGTVTSGGNPVADVEVSIVGSTQQQMTMANGAYNFPALMPGTYTVEFSKVGYEDQSHNVVLVADQAYTLNISLVPSSQISVSGLIVGSDNPGVGISGATIELSGILNYSGTTNAAGQFTIPGVLSGNSYSYVAYAPGYATVDGTINVGTTNYNMGTLTLPETNNPPLGLSAEENIAQTAVTLTWHPPGSSVSGPVEDFELSNGDWVASSSWTDPVGDFEWSNTYDVANWAPTYTGTNVVPPPNAYSGTGMWGTKINTNYTNSGGFNYLSKTFNLAGIANPQLRFWSWENVFGNFDYAQVSINGTVLWGPSWDYSATQWRERIVDLTPYAGMAEVVIRFEMWATTTVNYAGWYIDDVYVGPALDPIYASPAPNADPRFAALNEEAAAELVQRTARAPRLQSYESSAQSTRTDSRALLGYKLWRLNSGQEDNETAWTLLTPSVVTDTTFVDSAWASLPDGLYRWAAKSAYTNNITSVPAFSNTIRILRLDLSALSLQGSSTPAQGAPAVYNATIKNTGTTTQAGTAWTVKLMSGETELASAPGQTIAPNETLDIPITWTPTTPGPMAVYAKAVLPGDVVADNNNSPVLNLAVMPQGVVSVTIGDGGQTEGRPLDFYYKNSLFETLYYPDEIGRFGRINAISFYNNFVTNLPDKPTQIWLGQTNLADLSGGWILPTELTMVYNGNITYPSGENTVTIPLQTPFDYTSGNLVLYAYRPWEDTSYNTNDNFRVQTVGTNRARKLTSNTTQYDPAAPSAAGTQSAQFPMTTLHMQSIGDTPVFGISPAAYDYGTVLSGSDYDQVFTIVNAGGGALTVSSITIAGDPSFSLQSLPTLPGTIDFTQSLSFTLRYAPTVAGTHTATITLIDNMTRQTHTVQITAACVSPTLTSLPYQQNFDAVVAPDLPPDWHAFIQSSATAAIVKTYTTTPHSTPNTAGMANSSDAAAMLFLQAPPYGTEVQTNLTRVKFYARSSSANYVLSVGVMVNAQDPMTYTEVQSIPLTTTWTEYVVAFNGYQGTGKIVAFKHGLGGTSRTLYVDSVMLEFIPQNDLAVVGISGNSTPTSGVITPYTVQVHNWGSNAQTTYQVKLFNAAGVEQSAVAGPTVTPGQTVDVSLNWTPGDPGPSYIYAKVFLDGDQNSLNDQSANYNVSVNPQGVFSFVIGDGSQTARVPIDLYYKSSIFECIYYQDEILPSMVQGMIYGLSFNANITSTDIPPNLPIKIWLGGTQLADLSAGYVNASDLTLVFDGTVTIPNGENVITFSFAQPYLYLGGNLIMLVQRPQDTDYYATTDVFRAQTIGTNRARKMSSDSTVYDPNALTGGTLGGQFPMTTFHVIPGGVGHLTGTVTGAGGQPLADVQITSDTGGYVAQTNAAGLYNIMNILVDTYQFTYQRYGYISQTHTVNILEDETATQNVTMVQMPTVNVTGTVIASDTGLGLNGASIRLTGYEDYTASSTATGAFTIPGVYANQTYNYTIVAPGYSVQTGTIEVGATNYAMGNITLTEHAFPAMHVTAVVNNQNTAVDINWLAPNPNVLSITEGFEGANFPPIDWTQTITNTEPPNAQGVSATWGKFGSVTISSATVAPTEGEYQAGLWWSYSHQDEWLFTPSFTVPMDSYLYFDSYVFLGSNAGDHYYVKASTDNGQNWTVLWDASAQTGGWNYYTTPITISLADYVGQELKLAFHAIDPPSNDGLWYTWFIDGIYIGNEYDVIRFSPEELTQRSASAPTVGGLRTTLPSRAMQNGSLRSEPALPRPLPSQDERSLVGYKVWRLLSGQEADETSWISLTPNVITTPAYSDIDWQTLTNGDYRWAVKAIYTGDVSSVPAFSNILNVNIGTGMISGLVRTVNNQAIAGATVTAGTYSATTNSSGAYVLIVPEGTHNVTASATGYESQTVEGIVVAEDQTVTVNFNLVAGSGTEEDILPATQTALVGNYPNPFNPTTRIRFDLLEAGPVRIEIYNARGQLVRLLVSESRIPGQHSVIWDGTDNHGSPVGSGIYNYKMIAGKYSSTRKMILLK